MARRRITRIKVSEEELKSSGIKEDYYSDRRSDSGFIKITLNDKGASVLNSTTDKEIEEKQKELEALQKRRKELEKLEKKIDKKVSKKQRIKEKKKRKKEKKKLKNMPESSRILLGAIEEYKEKFHKNKKDKKDKFEGVTTGTRRRRTTNTQTSEEQAQKRKEEREKRDFEKRFEEPITLLRQTVVEVDKTIQELDKIIEDTKESRARNKGTILKDLFSAKASLLSNRTANARGIGDLQKTRFDLELKKTKEAGGSQNERNRDIALITRAFPQLIGNSGRIFGEEAAAPAAKSSGGKKGIKYNEGSGGKEKKGKKKRRRLNDEAEDMLLSRTTELLKKGEIEMSPHEASIDMEGKYQIAVKKSFKNHDWEFIAIDNNGNEIRGFKDKYPGLVPKKKHHNLRFDDNRDICKCSRTDQVFQVIQVPYI